MARAYDSIMNVNSMDVWREISRVILVIMYSMLSKAVSGYHYVKDKYLEYKYATDEVKPTERYFLTAEGRRDVLPPDDGVPEGWVYIEEWRDTKGHKKSVVLYEDDLVPRVWGMSPYEKPPAKCPWVWVGDRETEVDMTRTFDTFLVPGNVIKAELVSKLSTHANLIYIETKTFNQIKFPGDGITIEADDE